MDQQIIKLYDEYAHAPLPRRVFIERLTALVGSTAAAYAILPLLEPNYAIAQIPENDPSIKVRRVVIPGASGPVKAYLAEPRHPGKRASVLVCHENRGLVAHIEDETRRMAVAGYTALALDLLSPQGGTPVPFDDDKARIEYEKLDRALAVRDLVAGVNYAAELGNATGKVGAIGFCFGGGMVNALAVAAPAPLVCGVAFYGDEPKSEDVPRIKAKLLLHFGALDERIGAGWPAYEAALNKAGTGYEAYAYPGANHGFANASNGERFHEQASMLAWERTYAFLRRNLG